MYATDGQTDRQTDVRQSHRLMSRLLGVGYKKLWTNFEGWDCVTSKKDLDFRCDPDNDADTEFFFKRNFTTARCRDSCKNFARSAALDVEHSDSRFESIHRFILTNRFEWIRFVKKTGLSIH